MKFKPTPSESTMTLSTLIYLHSNLRVKNVNYFALIYIHSAALYLKRMLATSKRRGFNEITDLELLSSAV